MKTSGKVKDLCMQIMGLAMAISEFKQATIFVRYYPHVQQLDVDIYPFGYDTNFNDYIMHQIDLDSKNSEVRLKQIKKDLDELWE